MHAFAEYSDGMRYLLSIMDIFSKYGWIKPLKQKTGIAVADAFTNIFSCGRRPCKIWVDKGTEFYYKHVINNKHALGVELYSTENEENTVS